MPEYRRRLPHFQPDETYLFVTWRLWGSVAAEPAAILYPTPGHAFAAQDRELDRSAGGPHWLAIPSIADLVSRAILYGGSGRNFYSLSAWVLMPNHVHLSIRPSVALPVLMRWLKGSANYIENNPVSAGLVDSAEKWLWSSAGWQAEAPASPYEYS